MTAAITIEQAKTEKDLEQILDLQNTNHIHSLTAEEKESEGFVTVKHDMALLADMNHSAPQIIAKEGKKVVGYALVMLEEFGDAIPILTPMFKIFKKLSYQGKSVNEYKYYVMGQICISEGYRGQGIFEKLYLKHKEVYSPVFDLCLTEVSVRNTRSMRAHEKIGFKIIHTFKDNTDEWNVLLWDWKINPPPSIGEEKRV